MALVELCKIEQVNEDEPFQAVLAGHEPYAVFKSDDEIFVMLDTCNHSGASLSLEGHVEDGKVICGWHDATFDLRTGAGLSGPCTGPTKVFPAIVRDGAVFIEV